jgi:hypothetical protein
MNRANAWNILLKYKKTGAIVRTQCSHYRNYGNMRKFLVGLGDFQILELYESPSDEHLIRWDMFMNIIGK